MTKGQERLSSLFKDGKRLRKVIKKETELLKDIKLIMLTSWGRF